MNARTTRTHITLNKLNGTYPRSLEESGPGKHMKIEMPLPHLWGDRLLLKIWPRRPIQQPTLFLSSCPMGPQRHSHCFAMLAGRARLSVKLAMHTHTHSTRLRPLPRTTTHTPPFYREKPEPGPRTRRFPASTIERAPSTHLAEYQ